ncbi:MAG TPA: adenylate/guanylate cyclase domain-containing protein [Chlamydiales bacterium]
MAFIHRFKYRSLRVDILTIFLCLLLTSSTFTLLFSYSKNSKSILAFSKQTIELASSLMVERIDSLVESAERLSEMSVHLLLDPGNISLQNKELISHMLSIIEFYPDLFGLYYGTENGSSIEVFNLKAVGSTRLLSDPSQPLPPKSVYALQIINRKEANLGTLWQYLDENLKPVRVISDPLVEYDPRTRPWYKEALQAKGVHWTGVYDYSVFNEKGITVSQAVRNSDGQLEAVTGADLSLRFLSEFVEEKVVGKRGEAFIVDGQGRLISQNKAISPVVVQSIYREFQKENKIDVAVEVNGGDYLASIHPFPKTFGNDWSILIIVPRADFFAGLIAAQNEVVLISIAIALIAAILVVYFSKRISGPIVQLAQEIDQIKHLDFSPKQRIVSNIKEILFMDDSIGAMRIALQSFSRYIPKRVVLQLIEEGKEIAIGGEKKEITILFSDVTGFTGIAESYSTEKVMEALSQYFAILSKIFLQSEGTIDKYLGDGMMVFWNAPVSVADHAMKACRAALLAQAEINELNEKNSLLGNPVLLTRFGIHSGIAIVGNIGTLDRINYTAMGDAVNIAARLQPLNKTYHTSVLISEETKNLIGPKFTTRFIEEIELRGKKEKTKLYELVAYDKSH